MTYSHIIAEINAKVAYDTYYKDKMSYDEYVSIARLDPTSKFDTTLLVPGKYVKWLIEVIDPHKLDGAVNTSLTVYDNFKKRGLIKGAEKDIFYFKTVGNFIEFVENFTAESKRERIKKREANILKNETKYLFENEQWKLVTPLTYAASCYWGRDTKWCTAVMDDGDKTFNGYAADGPLYIVINKLDSTEKFQFHFPSGQYTDARDNEIDLSEFFSNINGNKSNFELLQFFQKIGELSSPDNFIDLRGGDAYFRDWETLVDCLPRSQPFLLSVLDGDYNNEYGGGTETAWDEVYDKDNVLNDFAKKKYPKLYEFYIVHKRDSTARENNWDGLEHAIEVNEDNDRDAIEEQFKELRQDVYSAVANATESSYSDGYYLSAIVALTEYLTSGGKIYHGNDGVLVEKVNPAWVIGACTTGFTTNFAKALRDYFATDAFERYNEAFSFDEDSVSDSYECSDEDIKRNLEYNLEYNLN